MKLITLIKEAQTHSTTAEILTGHAPKYFWT
jgi:hypothetical protein